MSPYLLFVEDDEASAYLALRALKINAFPGEVLRAHDGAEAVKHLISEKPKPALILLDLKLPKVSGIEVLERVRRTPDLSSIPVVILTASNLVQDRESAQALGITRYIVKPMDFHAFVTEMAEVKSLFVALSVLTKDGKRILPN